MRPTVALIAALVVSAAFAAEAVASNLVFVCAKNLCAASATGQGRVQLTRDGGGRGGYTRPSLSRNGRRLAFKHIDSAIERPGAIALFTAATAAPVRDLTAGPRDLYPSFAPSGKAVAFERSGAIWTVRTSGGKPKRLLRGARQPTWSK